MDAFEAQQRECFQIECGNKFSSMAFDGYYFYLVEMNGCKIYQYDIYFHFITAYNTVKEYSCICYDWNENCFWAASRTYHKAVYQLNLSFQEIGSIPIKSKEGTGSKIVSIACNYNSNQIVIAFPNCVIEIEKQCFEHYRKTAMNCSTFFFSLQPYRTGYATGKTERSSQYLCFYTEEGICQFQCFIDEDYFIDDGAIGINCHCNCKNDVLYLLLSRKDKTQCIMKLRMNFYDRGSLIQFCELNYDCCSGYEEALQSLAMVEASIARILNCEGEKMERVMDSCQDPQVLISLNQSVNNTILNLTHLEQILKSGRSELTRYMKSDCKSC